MIELTEVSKSFGPVTALEQVNLAVAANDIFGLIGPDSAGKTTLLRIITGLLDPDQGSVTLGGKPPAQSDRMEFGYMPQKFSLYGDLTITQNISFFGALYGLKKAVIEERAREILGITGLLPFQSRLADQLSGGMKQKLALTCALITRPGLLLLDEPTYGVDPVSRKDFWQILYRLNQEGMTIVVATPYMDEAELCHTVGFMSQGRLIAVDSPGRLIDIYAGKVLEIRAPVKDPYFFDMLPEVEDASFFGYKYHLTVKDMDSGRTAIADFLRAQGLDYQLKQITPSMDDVYAAMDKRSDSK